MRAIGLSGKQFTMLPFAYRPPWDGGLSRLLLPYSLFCY